MFSTSHRTSLWVGGFCLLFALSFPSFGQAADQTKTLATSVPFDLKGAPTVAEKKIEGMKKVLKTLLDEQAEAKKKDDIKKMNCVTVKLNLVKGLLRASERANVVLLEAVSGSDVPTAESYSKKIGTYSNSVDELFRTLDECMKGTPAEEGNTLVYISPEEETVVMGDYNPWEGTDSISGTEGYPVVPPASPFR